MTRKEICDQLPNAEKILFVLGAMFYDDYTQKGKNPITMEQAEQIPDEVIDAIFYFFTWDDQIDFELDPTAFLSWEVLTKVKVNRKKQGQ